MAEEAKVTETDEQVVDNEVDEAVDETEVTDSQSSEAEDSDTEVTEESEETEDASEADETEDEKPHEKTKQDYINERIARREAKREALRKAQDDYRANMDVNDWEQRVQSIENERFIERVENNISNAQRDIADAQNMPVFKEDPELFTDLMHETIEKYGVFHEELKESNGDPVFLGFYDPKTGNPISVKNIAQREANRLERIAERVRTSAKVEAAKGEAKMRSTAETPHTGGKSTVDTKEDSSLTAEQYARKYGLDSVRG